MALIRTKRSVLAVVLGVSLLAAGIASGGIPNDFDKYRAKLLGVLISKQLTTHHFSHKPVNDGLSKVAFELYLKQLDSRKRFFLSKDIEVLKAYETRIDDEFNSGAIQFPLVAEELFQERVRQVSGFVKEILAADFDFTSKENLETDPDKLEFCRTEEELKDRWRKTLKYQVAFRYLTMLDDQEKMKDLAGKPGSNGKAKKAGPPKSPEALRAEAREIIQKNTINLFERLLKTGPREGYDRYFGILAKAFDPHSDFLPPEEKEDFDIHMRGSLEGIGAVLQEEDGYIKVMRVIPGGAAFRQKEIEADDIILTVAQDGEEPVDITNMKVREAVTLIRGPKGSKVHLMVRKPDGAVLRVTLVRDVVQLEETFVKTVLLDNDKGESFGYIRIPSFYRDFEGTRGGGDGRNVTDDMKKALAEIKKKPVKGLIVDLRNNGGGALIDAVKVTGLFIKHGPIVQTKTTEEKIDTLYDYDPGIEYEGPLLILVNRFTASASEIMAGALQDYGRALIVGSDHSFGKGTVQTMVNLDTQISLLDINMNRYKPLGHLKMTTQQFYRITGDSTQNRGIEPDIVLPDRLQFVKAGEKYTEHVLPWNKIEPLAYRPWAGGRFDLPSLRSEVTRRIEASSEFREILKDSQEIKRRQDETVVSLNLDEIRKEMDRERSRKKARKGAAMTPEHATVRPDALDEGDDAVSRATTPEEMQKLLKEELRVDPYVGEAMHLLRQMSS